MIGFAPLYSRELTKYRSQSVTELTRQIFDGRNMMCAADPRHGRYLTALVMFRGKIPTWEFENNLFEKQNRSGSSNFVEWIPNNI